MITIKKENAKNEYELETTKGYILVQANNRNQARVIAEKQGMRVGSVNFVGSLK